MKLKFNKVIVFVVVVCMMALSLVSCRSKNDDIVIETIEVTTEETEVVETAKPTEIEIEENTEPAEPTEPTEDTINEDTDEENDKPNNNNDYSSSSNNTYNENVSATEPSYDYEQKENDTVTEVIPEETVVQEENTDNAESNLVSMGNFKLTAYCACSYCCGQWANGITATGTTATQGRTIAVDPSVIPYGTEVVINGNTYIAEDCGGAIKNNKIDIYFDSHQDALNFGIQYADVYIKE